MESKSIYHAMCLPLRRVPSQQFSRTFQSTRKTAKTEEEEVNTFHVVSGVVVLKKLHLTTCWYFSTQWEAHGRGLGFLSKSTAEGLRVTIHSTKDLSKYLNRKVRFKFLMPSRLSQDLLGAPLCYCQTGRPAEPMVTSLLHSSSS